ncbi:hypothetical protein ABZ957_09895 [Streptomyces sp. NPDC046316]
MSDFNVELGAVIPGALGFQTPVMGSEKYSEGDGFGIDGCTEPGG